MKRSSVKVGTRGSALALANAEFAVSRLREAHPGIKFNLVVIRTAADRIRTALQMRSAGADFFTREIDRALLKRKIDCAIHDLKDVPARLPEGLALGAILERDEASDAFVGRGEAAIHQLPPGSVIGTAGTRRQALLRAVSPQLEIEDLRGDLADCLGKLRNPRSRLAGIVVSACALRRLTAGSPLAHQLIARNVLVPAAGQGALAIEVRAADQDIRKILAPVHHPQTAAAVETERAFLRRMGTDRRIPLGVHAEITDEGLVKVTAAMAMPDGSQAVRAEATGQAEDPESVAAALETLMRSHGSDRIVKALRPAARRPKASVNGHRARKHARPRPRARRRR